MAQSTKLVKDLYLNEHVELIIPPASSTESGGIKTGYKGQYTPVLIDTYGNAYVNPPDTKYFSGSATNIDNSNKINVLCDNKTVTIANNKLSAIDTKYFNGSAISIDDQNHINVLCDNKTVTITDNKLSAVDTKYFNGNATRIDSNNKINVIADDLIDNNTLSVNHNGQIYVAKLPEGKIYSNGKGINVNNVDNMISLSAYLSDLLDGNNYYTKAECNDNFLSNNALVGYAKQQWVKDQGYLTKHQSLSDYYTKDECDEKFLSAHQSLSDYYTKDECDEKFLSAHNIYNFNKCIVADETPGQGFSSYSVKLKYDTDSLAVNSDNELYCTLSDTTYSDGKGIAIFGDNNSINVKIDNDTLSVDSNGYIYVARGGSEGKIYYAGTGININDKDVISLSAYLSDLIDGNNYYNKFECNKNFLSNNALAGYAKQQWVKDQGYLTSETIYRFSDGLLSSIDIENKSVTINVNVDDDTIKINPENTLYCTLSDTTYTAGNAISIYGSDNNINVLIDNNTIKYTDANALKVNLPAINYASGKGITVDNSNKREISINAYLSDLIDGDSYYNKAECDEKFLSAHQSLADYALLTDLSTYSFNKGLSSVYDPISKNTAVNVMIDNNTIKLDAQTKRLYATLPDDVARLSDVCSVDVGKGLAKTIDKIDDVIVVKISADVDDSTIGFTGDGKLKAFIKTPPTVYTGGRAISIGKDQSSELSTIDLDFNGPYLIVDSNDKLDIDIDKLKSEVAEYRAAAGIDIQNNYISTRLDNTSTVFNTNGEIAVNVEYISSLIPSITAGPDDQSTEWKDGLSTKIGVRLHDDGYILCDGEGLYLDDSIFDYHQISAKGYSGIVAWAENGTQQIGAQYQSTIYVRLGDGVSAAINAISAAMLNVQSKDCNGIETQQSWNISSTEPIYQTKVTAISGNGIVLNPEHLFEDKYPVYDIRLDPQTPIAVTLSDITIYYDPTINILGDVTNINLTGDLIVNGGGGSHAGIVLPGILTADLINNQLSVAGKTISHDDETGDVIENYYDNREFNYAGDVYETYKGDVTNNYTSNFFETFEGDVVNNYLSNIQQDFHGGVTNNYTSNFFETFEGDVRATYLSNFNETFEGGVTNNYMSTFNETFEGDVNMKYLSSFNETFEGDTHIKYGPTFELDTVNNIISSGDNVTYSFGKNTTFNFDQTQPLSINYFKTKDLTASTINTTEITTSSITAKAVDFGDPYDKGGLSIVYDENHGYYNSIAGFNGLTTRLETSAYIEEYHTRVYDDILYTDSGKNEYGTFIKHPSLNIKSSDECDVNLTATSFEVGNKVTDVISPIIKSDGKSIAIGDVRYTEEPLIDDTKSGLYVTKTYDEYLGEILTKTTLNAEYVKTTNGISVQLPYSRIISDKKTNVIETISVENGVQLNIGDFSNYPDPIISVNGHFTSLSADALYADVKLDKIDIDGKIKIPNDDQKSFININSISVIGNGTTAGCNAIIYTISSENDAITNDNIVFDGQDATNISANVKDINLNSKNEFNVNTNQKIDLEVHKDENNSFKLNISQDKMFLGQTYNHIGINNWNDITLDTMGKVIVNEYVGIQINIGNSDNIAEALSRITINAISTDTETHDKKQTTYCLSSININGLEFIAFAKSAVQDVVMVWVYANNESFGSVSGSGTYIVGESMTMTAIAKNGYSFAGWYTYDETTIESSENPYRLQATKGMKTTYYAKFVQTP